MVHPPPARSLGRIGLIVGAATSLSKLGGLVRQLALAAAFGIGPAYDAYNYAYVVPGFLLILLGGINGPFHSAMVSVLAKRDRQQARQLLETINTMVGTVLLLATVALVLGAGLVVDVTAPGLALAGKETIRQLAVVQVRLMAPLALLAGLVGLGFGALNAADAFWLPSLSPLLSSGAVLAGLGWLWWKLGADMGAPDQALLGGIVLGLSTTVGGLLQWLAQLPALGRLGLGWPRLRWRWRDEGVWEVLRVMGPATLSSGMLYIAVFTDLFFASLLPRQGVAAGLTYANLLVQTPLGIVSSMVLVPLLPALSRLVRASDGDGFRRQLRWGLMVSIAAMLPVGALLMVLAEPLIRTVYGHGAFDNQAAALVGALLVAYGLGMPAYLARDVVVRAFYALEDAVTPFRVSAVSIGLNVVLDWGLTGGPTPAGPLLPFNFGAPGLVLATMGVNMTAALVLMIRLKRHGLSLPWRPLLRDGLALLLATGAGGLAAALTSRLVAWPRGFVGGVLELLVSAGLGLASYGLLAQHLRVAEAEELLQLLRHRLRGRSGPVSSPEAH
ncbi:MAG: murein biosynthesis integral membrane protein MurJ [Synechococcus sp. SB0666_bin_14]|nr:murein biosynthesis integral membrane protein MurJ [Synechococcus sp. SB0666_bin_14]MYA91342.1 murein biosynthesis integral membrane protein MurJ [Synechococcus sp. SB0663_bin_10]MYG46766.1 murein biosynthesis integral membrane protein MurJ [Synechococcus sp. SB0675_bin_6]MYJ60165.1 murein biosynthesis integral membrane protein MurJ [Synechococcus sp. SB0672_bin_6]MYK92154.1 murein biosynthesis integral membrane protein MurJ [Synechococcus sp. SB0669_bin_8]